MKKILRFFWCYALIHFIFPVSAQEAYVDEVFFDDFNGSGVETSVWQIATWKEHGGQTGTDRCYVSDGKLNMVFINDSQDGFLSAAIQTRNEFLYGRWEARLKVSDVPGVLNSFYTIDWDNTADNTSGSDGTKEEIDIEFLTYTFDNNEGEVHFAVHAEGLTSFNTNPDIALDFNPSDDFHVWGFDIQPDYIEWFVDDRVLLRYNYSEHDVSITSPYQLKLNVWSAVNWINGPPTPDVESIYQIDWIRFTPSTVTHTAEKNDFRVGQNYPNPFTDKSTIPVSLVKPSKVVCNLYNSTGKMVKTIANNYYQPGEHNIDLSSELLEPGIYYYTIFVGDERITGKCLLGR